MKPFGLYFHVPFCPYRCHYCDFLSFTNQEAAIPAYVRALAGDLLSYSERCAGKEISSIFFGGGTPSLLSAEQVDEILASVRRNYALSPRAEITLESNPGSVTRGKLSGYLAAGVNRLSVGVQAIQDKHLARMGRIHTASDAEAALSAAREAGFVNVNVDLIFALPDQTMDEWADTLHAALAWKPEHLSIYGLQVEEGTPFSADQKAGRLPVPDEELQARMYEAALDETAAGGYSQYEISNFSMPGKECVHNLIYWKNVEYLGIGAGAVSYMDGERFWMTRNFGKYLSGEERVVGSERLSMEGAMGETMMLGLRLREGVSPEAFRRRFGKDLRGEYARAISRFENLGLLEWKNGNLAITREGLLVSNEIVSEFLSGAGASGRTDP